MGGRDSGRPKDGGGARRGGAGAAEKKAPLPCAVQATPRALGPAPAPPPPHPRKATPWARPSRLRLAPPPSRPAFPPALPPRRRRRGLVVSPPLCLALGPRGALDEGVLPRVPTALRTTRLVPPSLQETRVVGAEGRPHLKGYGGDG